MLSLHRFFLSWLLPGPGPEGDGLTYSTIADRDATLVSLRVEGVNGKHDSATSIVVKRNATVGSDLSTELVLSDATNGVGVGGTGYVSLPTLESGAASLRTPNHASLVAPPPSVPPPQLGYSEGRKDA